MYLAIAIITLLLCLAIVGYVCKQYYTEKKAKGTPRGSYSSATPETEVKEMLAWGIGLSIVVAGIWPITVPLCVVIAVSYYAWIKAVVWVTKQPESKK